MSATAPHRIANVIAYRMCQRGGHIPNRDRSLPDACDFHYREALALAELLVPNLAPGERFGQALSDVLNEVTRSIAKHGEQEHLPMGTGPDTMPLSTGAGVPYVDEVWLADHIADEFRTATKAHSHNEGGDGTVTWWEILREEVFEAAATDDTVALREELAQVAAVAIKMIDALDYAAAEDQAERRAEELPR